MPIPTILSYAAAYFSVIIAAAVLLRDRKSHAHWLFAAGVFLFAVEEAIRGFSYAAILPEDVVYRQKWVVALAVLVQPIWAGFCMTYARVNSTSVIQKWKWPLVVAGLIAGSFVAVFAGSL